MSALPAKADMLSVGINIRSVPLADLAAKLFANKLNVVDIGVGGGIFAI